MKVTGAPSLGDVDHQELIELVNFEMPFGRFKGRKLIDLPEPYVVWFKNEGFPNGKLGTRLAIMYEIKLNGLEAMLRPLLHGDVHGEVHGEVHPEVRDEGGAGD